MAEKGSGNTNKELTTQRLDLAADVVAQTIASATALGVNDIPTILGIVARESYFGIVKGGKIAAMQSDINPMKLTQNQFSDGTQPKNANEAAAYTRPENTIFKTRYDSSLKKGKISAVTGRPRKRPTETKWVVLRRRFEEIFEPPQHIRLF
ncbi:MAG: hypothetical protein IPK58_05340 [Acidobacteria bacterium]|nr:hypothetical protein [Acidobacteriota bacterium]